MKAKKTLLIVEDEDAILFSLQRILELSGEYEIVTAVNGKDALKKMDSFLPDLILSDILMPEMDGIEFCRKIRNNELTENLPFIFLTAKKEMMIEGFKVGADDFIVKPFTVDEVIAKIEAIFRRVKNTREQANQLKGNLSEYSLDKVLELCHNKSVSGEIILQASGMIGKIQLERGDITKVRYKKLADDEALDNLRGWDSGIFVIRPIGVKLKPEFMLSTSKEDTLKKLDEPVEIAKDVWWVGYRNLRALMQINVYLRQFRKKGKVFNYLIDPGSPIDFPSVSQKISNVVGDLSKIHLYSLSNHDPDVCMNSVFIRNANPRAVCLTTEENWRLIAHYEINYKSVKFVNSFKDWKVKLATDHQITYIPSPFCHSKGAFLTYDLETRILFTGDLFSGVSDANRINQLYAEEADWNGIQAFHQIYMPTNKALRHVINLIRQLDPPPLMIAPQHGNILRGESLDQFMERIYYLDVGMELLEKSYSPEEVEAYMKACNELIEYCVSFIPLDRIIKKVKSNSQIISMCEFKNGKVLKIFSKPELTYKHITMTLIQGENPQTINQIKSIALKITFSKGLPAPSLDWDTSEILHSHSEKLFNNSADGANT